ncbi:MAG: hypothetical protein J6D18_00640 [Erysipelotrichaceae bacterium]|nr:hypothetical protein [Erysipelotrichaceae bacterium]
MNKQDIKQIAAREITVEVTDIATGETFRRTLPIEYLETASFVRMFGEDLKGNPSEIVLYTSFSQKKVQDLTGSGIDYDPCKTHKK